MKQSWVKQHTLWLWLGLLVVVSALVAGVVLAAGRQPAVPREYGYFRIDLPEPSYSRYQGAQPYSFLLSNYAVVRPHGKPAERDWADIVYPAWHATVHCSYMPVKGNLKQLSDDAMEFVYKHTIKASAIPEQMYVNDEEKVYALLFDFEGNTATTMQFVVTDSVRHFFRGAVYFNNVPNADSIAPVASFIRQDMVTLIESFRWR